MPCFLTFAFLILSGSQAGPLAGLATMEIEPVKTWTRFVPRRGLKGRTTRLLAREHLARILSVFHQHKVLLFSHEVFLHLPLAQDEL